LAAAAIRKADFSSDATRAGNRAAAAVARFAASFAEIGAGLRNTHSADARRADLVRSRTDWASQLAAAAVVDAATAVRGAGFRGAILTHIGDAMAALRARAIVATARQFSATAIVDGPTIEGSAGFLGATLAHVRNAKKVRSAGAVIRAARELAAATIRQRTAIGVLGFASRWNAGHAFVVGANQARGAPRTAIGAAAVLHARVARIVHLPALGTGRRTRRVHGHGARAATQDPAATIGDGAASTRWQVSALLLRADSASERHCIADLTGRASAAIGATAAAIRHFAATPSTDDLWTSRTLIRLTSRSNGARSPAGNRVVTRIRDKPAGFARACGSLRDASTRGSIAKLSLGARATREHVTATISNLTTRGLGVSARARLTIRRCARGATFTCGATSGRDSAISTRCGARRLARNGVRGTARRSTETRRPSARCLATLGTTTGHRRESYRNQT